MALSADTLTSWLPSVTLPAFRRLKAVWGRMGACSLYRLVQGMGGVWRLFDIMHGSLDISRVQRASCEIHSVGVVYASMCISMAIHN